MTFDELWLRRRARFLFLCAGLFFLIALTAIRYFILPFFDAKLTQGALPTLAKIIEDLSTTIIVTALVGWFLSNLTTPNVARAGVAVIEPRELKLEFADALRTSSSWFFYGGCGRYFRTGVLNEMARRVASGSGTKTLHAIILNPANDVLCERHARYRSGTRRGKKDGIWSESRVRHELLVTIIVALKTRYREGLLDIRISIVDQFSSFRADIAESCAIETREDKDGPGLKSQYGTYFYEALKDEFAILLEQSFSLTNGGKECAAITDEHSLQIAIDAISIPGLKLNLSDYVEILKILKSHKNPYD